MRQPIAVEVASFDLNQTEPQINRAVDAFAEYIEQIPRTKSTRSKYGLLGPAGKALTELKAGRYDRDSLIGYTLRTQENTRTGPVAPEVPITALSALEKALDEILGLLRSAPEPYHPVILDRLNYGLYYRLRRAQIQNKELVRQDWIRFLEKKYASAEAMSEAWGRQVADFQGLHLPSRQAPKGHKRSKTEQADVEEFYTTRTSIASDED